MNALRKLSTGQRAAVALAALVIATAVTEIITGAGPGVRAVTIGVLALITGCYYTLRLIGPAKGHHAAPRGFTTADQWPAATEQVIESVVVDGRPPWEDTPPPDGYIVATGTLSGGRLTSASIAVLPPLPPPRALPAYVIKAIGHDGDTEAAAKSMWTRAHARWLAAQIRDGAL